MKKIHKSEGLIGLYRVFLIINLGFRSDIIIFWTIKCYFFRCILEI
jgi:hypothetical protein